MTIEDAKRAVIAAVGDSNSLNRALDDLVTAVREHDAGLVRGCAPKDPCEEEAPIVWALDVAAVAVRRGHL